MTTTKENTTKNPLQGKGKPADAAEKKTLMPSKDRVNKIVENAKKKETEKKEQAAKPKKEKAGTAGKWIYPADVTSTDAKKKFRLQARNKIRTLQKDESKAKELAEYKKLHCVDPSIVY